jgi:ABC-type multidrug transport system fused ATPase/permease subunit
VLVATLVQAVTSYVVAQIVGMAAQRAITDMRKKVEQHVIRLPIATFDRTKSGILMARIMSDAEGLRNLVGMGLVQMFRGVLTSVVALAALLWLNWRLTLVMLVALSAFASVMMFSFRRVRPLFRRRGEINARVTGRLGETLGGIRVVKAYATEKHEDRVFAMGSHELLRNGAKTITATAAVGAVTTVIVGVTAAAMMVIGGHSIAAGTMTLGDFVMYTFFLGLLAVPIVTVGSVGTQLNEAFAGLDRIREVMGEPLEPGADGEGEAFGRPHGEVEFEDVSFEYQPGRPVLRHVSFKANARTTTALVGSSGSGKSTLLNLVMRFNDPTGGRVLVDGRDLAGIRLYDYRSSLGVVLQDNFLFDGTIAENILYGRPRATREQMVEAARIAHVDEFVEPLEEKYDTIVGERGIKLSGGQRQRIAIARAILADPAILILDEATSSLDSESEAKIQGALRELRRGRTTFVIAHRLSTIRNADMILVLERGEVVERGTHAALLAANGRYRELYERQYGAESDRFINPGEELPDAERVQGEEDDFTAGAPGEEDIVLR